MKRNKPDGQTGKGALQKEVGGFIGYLVVGGLATLVEWAGFQLFCGLLGIQYLVATALAFFFSTFANWLFGKLLVFKEANPIGIYKEIAAIYAASIAGLIFNLVIMYVLVGRFSMGKMAAKIVATVVVFAYNYLIRKLVIYRG